MKGRPLQLSWVVAGSTEHGSSSSATAFTNEGWDEWSDFTGAAPDSLSLTDGDVGRGWSDYQKGAPDSDEEVPPGWSEDQEEAPEDSSTGAEMSGEAVDIITGQQYSGAQVTLSQPPISQCLYGPLILPNHIHSPVIIAIQPNIDFTLSQAVVCTADCSTLELLHCRRRLLVSGTP